MIKRILIPLLLLAFPAFAQQGTPAQTAARRRNRRPRAVADDSQEGRWPSSTAKPSPSKSSTACTRTSTRRCGRTTTRTAAKAPSSRTTSASVCCIQEAFKSGFDKKPDVVAALESARESALFDRYVRDVVAAAIVTDKDIKDYYDAHPDDFATPEKVHVRHIVIAVTNAGPAPKTEGQALEQISKIAAELRAADVASAQGKPDPATMAQACASRTSRRPRKSTPKMARRRAAAILDGCRKASPIPTFEAAAWGMKPGVISGVVHTKFGYHLIFVEGKRAGGHRAVRLGEERHSRVPDDAESDGRRQRRDPADERAARNSRISVFPENIK